MDVVFAVGQYNLVSMALNTLGVQLDDGLEWAGFEGNPLKGTLTLALSQRERGLIPGNPPRPFDKLRATPPTEGIKKEGIKKERVWEID